MKFNKNTVFALVLTASAYAVLSYVGLHIEGLGLIGIFLICNPYRFGDTVYSVFGGFSEKDIYSLFGLYQNAGGNAKQAFGISLYQNAGGDAFQFFGISLYQNAGRNADQGIGVSLYQNAGGNAYQCIGISLYQNAGGNAKQAFGISLYQNAGRNADQGIGVSLYQNAGEDVQQVIGVILYKRFSTTTTPWTSISLITKCSPKK